MCITRSVLGSGDNNVLVFVKERNVRVAHWRLEKGRQREL